MVLHDVGECGARRVARDVDVSVDGVAGHAPALLLVTPRSET